MSEQKVMDKKALYEKAVSYAKKSFSFNQVEEARQILLELGDYEDSAKYLEDCERFLSHQIGTKVTFGNYKGKELVWTILETDGCSMLLFADDVIDTVPFHYERAEVTWNNCELRKWLNKYFLETAFSFKERLRVMISAVDNHTDARWGDNNGPDTKDKVFIFSCEDVLARFPEQSQRDIGKWWWLKGHGCSNLNQKAVYSDGTIYEEGISSNSTDVGVRPVMRVRIAR